MTSDELTLDQRAMVDVWERHMAAEFETKSIDATMATMASVLAQVGLIDAERLPATGIEASRKVVAPAQEPSNRWIERAS